MAGGCCCAFIGGRCFGRALGAAAGTGRAPAEPASSPNPLPSAPKICCDGDAVVLAVSVLWAAVCGGSGGGGSAEAESTAVIVMVVVASARPFRWRLRSSTIASSLWSSARVLLVVVVVVVVFVAAGGGGRSGAGGVAGVVVSLRFLGACRVSSSMASGVVLGRDTPCASSGASGRRGVSSGMGL